MANDDMNHMNHIEDVALSDVAVLRDKESTYKGSWKRAGGRSAWFMARRNMDRLLTMMAPPKDPGDGFNLQNVDDTIKALQQGGFTSSDETARYAAKFPGSPNATISMIKYLRDSYIAEDIFAKIAEKPKGADGTVLACVRDLRRYFTLVESELVAEGIVEVEAPAQSNLYNPAITDIYGMIAAECKLPREEVKQRIFELFYKKEDVRSAPDVGHSVSGGAVAAALDRINTRRGRMEPLGDTREQFAEGGVIAEKPDYTALLADRAIVQELDGGALDRLNERLDKPIRELDPNVKAMISDGMVHEAGQRIRPATAADYEMASTTVAHVGDTPSCGDGSFDARMRAGPPTPRHDDAGAQHASLYPWQLNKEQADTLKGRIGELFFVFYNQRGPGNFRLEPAVQSEKLPKELHGQYELWDGTTWLIKRDRLPEELQEDYPHLQQEMNAFEYDQSPSEFKFMYALLGEKWTMKPEHAMRWAAAV